MAISRLSNIVNSIVENRKKEISKAVYNYESKVKDIERKLDKGGSVSEAMSSLRSLFRYNLSNDDYRNIERELNYNVK